MVGWIAKSDPLDPGSSTRQPSRATGRLSCGRICARPSRCRPHADSTRTLPRLCCWSGTSRWCSIDSWKEGSGTQTCGISINGKPIEPNNPLGHPLASAYDLKTIRIPTETKDGKVQVQAYLLPSENEITSHHKAEGPEAVEPCLDLIGLHGKRNETQGLFIYRHDRLIKWGGWHQMWETNDEKTKLARVVVNFGRDLDDSFKINISKQIVQLPQQLQAEIKKIADVARRDSQKKYRKEIPLPPPPPPIAPTDGGSGRGLGPTAGPRLPIPPGPAGKPPALQNSRRASP